MHELNNIIFITIDSLRADRLGCYGNSRSLSPNLDRLATCSIRFSHAFSNGPNTPHAFPAIMSGRSALVSEKLGLFDAPVTLAEILSDAGYKTAGVNAANPYVSRYFKYDRGFDSFDDFVDFQIPAPSGRKTAGGASPISSTHAAARIAIPGLDVERYLVSESSIHAKAQLETQLSAYTASLLQELAGSPFFLWLHLMDTHYPYLPQRQAQAALGMEPIMKDENFRLNTRLREHLDLSPVMLGKVQDLYDATVLQVDQKIGAVLSCLQRQGLFDDALIVCTADHGEEFMEHGDMQHKSKLFDELLHVPLLIKRPGQVQGEVTSDIVSLLRISPTILRLAGLDNGLQLRSLFDSAGPGIWANAARGVDGGPPADALMFHTDRVPKVYACRTGNWKLIYDTETREMQLYHLIEDAMELQDVFARDRKHVAALEDGLMQHVRDLEFVRVRDQVARIQDSSLGVDDS